MVSIPCNFISFSSCLPKKLPLFKKHKTPFFSYPSQIKHRTHFLNAINNSNNSTSSQPSNSQDQQLRTLFPGGFKRPEIRIPTVVLKVSDEEVLRKDDGCVLDAVSVGVSKGVGIVVLESSGEDGDEGGGRLYDAACVLKDVVGDRAYLLIRDRVDVASAVGASGVLLSDQGLPPIVARNMMMTSKSDTVYLPLVARIVKTINSAINATSSEGADFLIMGNAIENFASVLGNAVKNQVKVPIFFSIVDSFGGDLPISFVWKLLESGAPGIVMSTDNLKLFGDAVLKKIFSTANPVIGIQQDGHLNSRSSELEVIRDMLIEKKGIAGFTKLDDKEVQLIESERLLLREATSVIQEAAPTMKEVGLLEDAISRLSEPFLLVIVGEFNSGKSTVINALLGRSYLKEGVIPTTNEITLLSYSDKDIDEQERCQRNLDGQFICYLSAPILKNMNLVDTPGTNVILQRQQRLTEEFVPRADLILFILSADRPLTDSEVEEATAFIKKNAQKLLNVEDIRLYPVSARSALEAKISASNYSGRNYDELLFNDPCWTTSRFYELERFLFSFLDGSTDTGMERVRLKLETPINIADRLLNSCVRLVKQDYQNASQDLISMKEMVSTVDVCIMKMESQSNSWKKRIVSEIDTAKSRAINLVESTLKLSNVDLISTYAFKGERSRPLPATLAVQNEIINPALTEAQRLLGEYSSWLLSNNDNEGKLFIERFDKQWHRLYEDNMVKPENCGLLRKGDEFSLTVLKDFSANAAARLFEQEIREVVLGTFGGLGAAGLSASLLTSVLPSTLEDLLALGFCSAGGLLAISKFPGRQKEVIEKVSKVADGLAFEIMEAMQKDLMQAIERLNNFVEVISKPYQVAAQRRIDRSLKTQEELEKVERKLLDLKVEIQNLHAS